MNNMAKDVMQRFARWGMPSLPGNIRLMKLGFFLGAALLAAAAGAIPANDRYTNAVTLGGLTGSVSSTNTPPFDFPAPTTNLPVQFFRALLAP